MAPDLGSYTTYASTDSISSGSVGSMVMTPSCPVLDVVPTFHVYCSDSDAHEQCAQRTGEHGQPVHRNGTEVRARAVGGIEAPNADGGGEGQIAVRLQEGQAAVDSHHARTREQVVLVALRGEPSGVAARLIVP